MSGIIDNFQLGVSWTKQTEHSSAIWKLKVSIYLEIIHSNNKNIYKHIL